MKVLIDAVTLIGAAFLLHVTIWRIFIPVHQTRALLLIFFGMLMAGLGATFAGIPPRLSLPEALHVAIFHVSASLAYICFYSAIEGTSPSTAIVVMTAEAGQTGCCRDDYKVIINNDLLIGSRFRAMIRDGLVCELPTGYRLTDRGFRLGHLFALAFGFLGLSDAG
jgi:hypothetical protein